MGMNLMFSEMLSFHFLHLQGRVVHLQGHVVQSVTCLTADTYLTADPGVTSLILARSYTFVEIDHDIISMVILLPPLI